VTGRTTDDRKFARLVVQKAAGALCRVGPTRPFIFAVSIARTRIRAINGLHFVTTKLFEQGPIVYDSSVTVEYDDEDEGDVATIRGDDESEMRDWKGV
jgi:hypothetical protein